MIKKYKNTVKWVVINTLYATSVYFGLFEGVEGALNIAIVATWAMIAFSFLLVPQSTVKVLAEKEFNRGVIPIVAVSFDIAIASAFAWHGHFLITALLIIHSALIEGFYARVAELKKTKAEQAA